MSLFWVKCQVLIRSENSGHVQNITTLICADFELHGNIIVHFLVHKNLKWYVDWTSWCSNINILDVLGL